MQIIDSPKGTERIFMANNQSIWRQCKKKRRYRDENEVRKMMKIRQNASGQRLDYYFCEYCKGYHLTHKATMYEGWVDLGQTDGQIED